MPSDTPSIDQMRLAVAQATPRNKAVGAVADELARFKEFANRYELNKKIPLLGGSSVGDLLLGKSPEEVDRWSYGDSPFRRPPVETGASYLDFVKPGRGEALTDVASSLPIGTAAKVAKMAAASKGLPLVMGAVKSAAKENSELEKILAKVKPIEELGPEEFPEHIPRPLSTKKEVTGYHVTQDITAPLKEGLLTNRNVGDNNIQGWAPEHVGGAYFWSHPQVARVQRERFFEMDPDAAKHEGPILQFKVHEDEHHLVPDEDSGASKWRDSFQGGSFATKNPVSMDRLEAIYSADPAATKAQIIEALSPPVKEQKMLQGIYRGYAGDNPASAQEGSIYASPQKAVADYYANKRAAQTGEEPHAEMLMVDPFSGREYGHATAGTGANPPLVTRARELTPEEIKSSNQLYANGGIVSLITDPDAMRYELMRNQ